MKSIYRDIILAWRNLQKNKITSIINVLGLTIGLASAVLAILYARHELTFESCHENAERLNRVFIAGNFGEFNRIPQSFGPEGQELKNLFPEIEKFSISRNTNGTVRVGDNIFNEENILYADSSFYELFTIPFKKGQPSQDPLSVVISERIAQRYFGKDNPINQNISINTYGEKVDFTITGVFKDFPSNTHIQADFIIPFSIIKRTPYRNFQSYYSADFNTYLLLSEQTNYKVLNNKIKTQFKIPVPIENIHAFVMPIKEMHFNGFFDNNKGKLMGFLIGGFFVLITSILNYINLTNILYSNRKKEIGIRKVNGGIWKNIFYQFFSDTSIITFFCFCAAIVLILLILPWFNSLMDTQITLSFHWQVFILCFFLYFVTVLLSGIYPAIRFSFLKPVNLLNKNNLGFKGHSWSRYLLTSFQFIIAIIFIQFILIFQKQHRHLQDENIRGYNGENVICISGYPWGNLNKVKEELLKNPGIEAVSWGSQLPSMGLNISMDWKEENNKIPASIYYFEDDYLTLFNIKMLEGRFFSKKFPSDKNNGIVINKETSEILGYKESLGKQVLVRGKYYTIIGLVDRYMCHPPIFDMGPLLILPGRDLTKFLLIKVKENNREATHKYITNTLKDINPEYPIELVYHQDYIYSQKEARSHITMYSLIDLFFKLTIIMSLVGLFGMSIYVANRKIKEIGIRKVCGGSAFDMIFKLLRGLIIQVLIAICIATPIVFTISKGYLLTFPYGIKPGPLFYFTGGGMALILMILTVGWQSWQAARRNPVEALRYE